MDIWQMIVFQRILQLIVQISGFSVFPQLASNLHLLDESFQTRTQAPKVIDCRETFEEKHQLLSIFGLVLVNSVHEFWQSERSAAEKQLVPIFELLEARVFFGSVETFVLSQMFLGEVFSA